MGKIFLVNTSRICIFVATIASLLSMGGGGLVLPPFKSLSWLKTSSTNIGLYGACLSAKLSGNLFGINDDWKDLQNANCANMFTNGPTPVGITGRLNPRDEIMTSSINALAIVVALSSLFTSSVTRPQAYTTLTFAAFVFQAITFGLATYQFKQVWSNLAESDGGISFGIGMYLSGSSAIVLFIGGLLGWCAIKAGGRGYKEYSNFRDSQDTYY